MRTAIPSGQRLAGHEELLVRALGAIRAGHGGLTKDELSAIDQMLARASERTQNDGARSELDAIRTLVRRVLATAIGSPHRNEGADARAAVLLPRSTSPDDSHVVVDEGSLTLTISGERVACKPTSFRLLAYLIKWRGHWIRSETLGREILQAAFQSDASNVRWHVLQARRALRSRGGWLHSDNRLGFMFDHGSCGRRHCAAGNGVSIGNATAIASTKRAGP